MIDFSLVSFIVGNGYTISVHGPHLPERGSVRFPTPLHSQSLEPHSSTHHLDMDKLEQHARDSILGGMCSALMLSYERERSARAALDQLDVKKCIECILEDSRFYARKELIAPLKDGELRPIIEQEARQLLAAMRKFIGME